MNDEASTWENPSGLQTRDETVDQMNRWLINSLDLVASLGKTYQSELERHWEPGTNINVTKPVLKRLLDFRAMAFLTVDEESMDFNIIDCDPAGERRLVEKELDYQVEGGTFAWALYRNRPIFVAAKDPGKRTMLHVLATKKRVVGMFLGILDSADQFVPDATQKLISIVLLNCANLIESSALYNELNNHAVELARTNKILRREIRVRKQAEEELQRANESLTAANARMSRMMADLELTRDELKLALDIAKQSDRLKSEFLANTSHELRTPLNSIIGFLKLILDDLCDSPEEEREFLKNALESSHLLLKLINDVLDIAKIEAGKMELTLEAVHLQDVFDEVYVLTHVQAEHKRIDLNFSLGQEKEIVVDADYQKLKQVLLNLVGNSIKFTSQGEIEIWAHAVPEKGFAAIQVRDTGVGIPVGKQKTIFDKFTQADGSRSRKFGGTGLGLTITKSLVELMKGDIELISPGIDQGTTVTFTLPLSEKSIKKVPEKVAEKWAKGIAT